MRFSRKFVLRSMLALLIIAALVLSGCQSKLEKTEVTTTTTTPVPTPTSAANNDLQEITKDLQEIEKLLQELDNLEKDLNNFSV